MIYVPEVKRILFYSEPVDMRKSFNGLTGVTRQLLDENPLSGDMFVFSNRKGNYVKILFWDRTGFCIYAKRLEPTVLRRGSNRPAAGFPDLHSCRTPL